jgi:hypothetical protein
MIEHLHLVLVIEAVLEVNPGGVVSVAGKGRRGLTAPGGENRGDLTSRAGGPAEGPRGLTPPGGENRAYMASRRPHRGLAPCSAPARAGRGGDRRDSGSTGGRGVPGGARRFRRGCRAARRRRRAGLHRLLSRLEVLDSADAVVVVAGMEGALASVVGGLTAGPVVAVPTSVGYGASLERITALVAMLAGCAAGVVVTGIDNGFGAAHAVARLIGPRRVSVETRGAPPRLKR